MPFNSQPTPLVAVYLRNMSAESRERLHRIAGANGLTLAQTVERLIELHDAIRYATGTTEDDRIAAFASRRLTACDLDY
jgi:hypothetical protein